MADDETNIVLTADVSGYERSIDQAANATNMLLVGVQKLTTAIDSAFKIAGKTMQIGGAGMIASVTAAGVAAAKLESQMMSLQAATELTSKTQVQADQRMNMFAKSVTGLRSEFGMTSQEAISLVSQLDKLGQSNRNVEAISRSFAQLGTVAGESVSGLADGMISLQRAMGTEGVRATKEMNGALAQLSTSSGASATGVLQFSNSLAPVAKMAGLSQRELMGVSTAFVKSGQDGYAAANAFNKMLTDITRNVQYGSPEIASYANLIGVSVESFKTMPKAEVVTRIFEEINGQGPQALKTLERMGLDGVRSMKAIQGVAQSGGIRKTIAEAMGTSGSSEMENASGEAFKGFNEQLKKIAENGKMIAEAFGSGVLPAMSKLAEVINSILAPMRAMMQALGGLPGGVAMLAGLGLVGAGAVTKAFTGLSTLGLATGAYRTIRGGYRFGAGADNLSEREQRQAQAFTDRQAGRPAPGNFLQHWLYGRGAAAAEFRQGMREGMGDSDEDRARKAEEAANRKPGLRGMIQRGTIGATSLMGGFVGAGLVPLSSDAWDNNMNRDKRYAAFQSATGREALGYNKVEQAKVGLKTAWDARDEDKATRAAAVAQAKAEMAAHQQNTGAINTATNSTKTYSTATGALLGETRALTGAMAQAAATTAKMGAIGAARGIEAAAPGLWSGAKGLASSAFAMAGGGIGLGLMGGMYAYGKHREGEEAAMAVLKDNTNTSPGGVYAAALGEAAAATRSFADVVKEEAAKAKTYGFTGVATAEEAERASQTREKLTFEGLKGATLQEKKSISGAFYATQPSDAQQQEFRMDLMRQYGTDDKGMGRVNEIIAAGQKNNTNLLPLFQRTNYEGQKLRSIGDFFKGGSQEGLDKAGMTGSVIQELMASAGNSKQRSQIGLMSMNTMNTAAQEHMIAPGLYTKGGVRSSVTAYLKGQMGDEATPEDAEAVTRAITGARGDLTKMRQLLAQSGTTIGDIVEQQTRDVQKMGGNVEAMTLPSQAFYRSGWEAAGLEPSVLAKLKDSSNPAVSGMFNSTTSDVSRISMNAMSNEADTDAQARAARAMADEFIRTTGSVQGATMGLNELKSTAQSTSNAMYIQADAAVKVVRSRQAEAMPSMNSWEQGKELMENYRTSVRTNANRPYQGSEAQVAQDRAGAVGFFNQTEAKLKSFALQWREFQVQRDRGEAAYELQRGYSISDFNRNRQWAEDDFNRSRKWAEQDFKRGREWAEQDYRRQRQWATDSFYKQRHRQEVEFQHQQEQLFLQTAKSMTNIYERMNVQRTWDAANLYQNMMDQQTKLAEQQEQLAALRKAGLSNDAITMMGLNDPAQMQQLARTADDILNDPKMIANFNKAAQDRLSAGQAIATDASNTQWTEMNRSFKLGMDNSLEDFNEGMAHQETQFGIMQKHQQEQFDIVQGHQLEQMVDSQDKQLTVFNDGLIRMHDAYDLGMKQARDDMDRGMTEITGSFNDLANLALSTLGGTANTQMTNTLTALGYTKDQVLVLTTDTVTAIEKMYGDLGITPSGTNAAYQPGGSVYNSQVPAGPDGRRAYGGPINGYSPNPRADNIHILATAGEYMQPVDAVNYYGKDFMDAVRTKKLPRFAEGGMVYKQMESWMAKNLPDTRVTSDYRPGAITALGNVSEHGKGNAVDMTPSMQAFNKILNTFGSKIYQLFYAPADGRTILRGRPWHMDSVTKGNHWNHVHWAMKSMNGLGGLTGGDGGGSLWDGSYESLLAIIQKMASVKAYNTMMAKHSITPMRQLDHDMLAKLLATKAYADASAGGSSFDVGYSASTGSSSLKGMVQDKAGRRGWTGSNWSALDQLIAHESSWNPNAKNPSSTAYGLFQFLNSTWGSVGATKTSDPAKQADAGLKYIAQRYGTPSKAWSFWNSHTPHWYADGAVINGPKTIGVGEAGPEAVVPLNGKGVDFVFELMKKNSTEAQRAMLATNGTVQRASTVSYYSRIDKSTQITGPITVQAQDPDEMLRKIQAKKSLEALKGRH